MSKQHTNQLLSDTIKFIELLHQIFETDIWHKNNFRDMTIPAGIYSISVNINTYKAFYNWLTQQRNELFESLQSDYDNLIRYTNIDIPKMIKQLNKLNKHKLLSTGLLSPLSILLNVSERSKPKNKKYVKSVKKFVNKRINKTFKLYDDSKETKTLKFLIEKDILKYIDMLDKGDNKLMQFLKRNCVFYNYPYDNWINFAKAFFNRCLNPIYIDEFRNYYFIYYNTIRSELDIQEAINDSNRSTNNYQYRIWISFYIFLERLKDIIDPYNLDPSPPKILHLFHQQHDYIVNGNIISDMIKFRELINLTTTNEIKNFFFRRRPITKFR